MSCFCTGACKATGICPNQTAARGSYPWTLPVAPPSRPPAIHVGRVEIREGLTEEDVRRIIREELGPDRAQGV